MAGNGNRKGRDAVILALASGESAKGAAAKAGVGERTVYRWLGEEEFRRQVSAARAEMFAQALGRMADGAASAALVLRQLCFAAASESVRLGAARSLLEYGLKLREHVELEDRLAVVEQRIADEEGRR
jgi:transposase